MDKEILAKAETSLREQFYGFEDKIRQAIGFPTDVPTPAMPMPYLVDTFEDYLIIELQGKLIKVPYTMAEDKISLNWAEATQVARRTVYEPMKSESVSKPEVTENYVRVPVNECKITATIDIDKQSGIKALYCGDEKQIATYLFPKDKYSMDEAQAWIKEHEQSKSDGKSLMRKSSQILKADDDKHLVYGIVMEPNTVDSQGDKTTAEEIERAAHKFMMDSQVIYSEHEKYEPACRIVESYIAPEDMKMGNYDVKKGSWIMVTHVDNPDLWDAVKKGELTGYSIRGFAQRT